VLKKIVKGKADIFGDQSQEQGGDVPSRMERHGSASSIGMAELLVRASLTHFLETKFFQNPGDLQGLQYRIFRHGQETITICVPINSASMDGGPSSSSISITSRKLT
jgi:hypothetical protein